MVKKPKVFQNKIDKVIKNNKTVFDSSKEEVLEIVKEDVNKENNVDKVDSNSSVVDKITRLLNREGYVFNVPVCIITHDNKYETNIASVVNNCIITLDNDIIPLDDVLDIEINKIDK